MTAANRPSDDALRELRYALAEADAEAPPKELRARVLTAALAARPACAPSQPAAPIPGAEALVVPTGAPVGKDGGSCRPSGNHS